MDDLDKRVSQTVAVLQQATKEHGVFVTVDGRVGEVDAAALVGYAPGTLRNMRSAGGGPAFFNRPLSGSAKSYRLHDLATWLERAREETI